MSYVMLSNPRVGSKYVLQSLTQAEDGEYLGEAFQHGYNDDILLPSNSNWGLKLHTYQCINLGKAKTDSIMNRPDVKRVLLYREDLVDKTLSMIIANNDNIWQVHSADHKNPTGLIEHTSEVERVILEVLTQEIQLYKLAKRYTWDYVFCYETLTGDPKIDFKVDIDSANLSKKIYSKVDKYERFWDPKGIVDHIKKLAESMNIKLYNTPKYQLRKV